MSYNLKITKYLVCIFSILFAFFAYSQDVENETTNTENSDELNAEQVIEQSSEQKTENESVNTGSSNRNFDVFRPSEDISEDLAVPFPVDI